MYGGTIVAKTSYFGGGEVKESFLVWTMSNGRS